MKRLTQEASGLAKREYATFARLATPIKIQDFLDALPMNFEKRGSTLRSPRRALAEGKAHCIEGALLAAAALWIAGEPPVIMNLSARLGRGDVDHVVALYKRGGRFGAISKTNHAVLRFRDPIYRTPRELALSYFHEWFLNEPAKAAKGGSPGAATALRGEKTLECYSRPLDLRRFGTNWFTAPKDLWDIDDALSGRKHYFLVPKGNWRYVRRADPMERKAGSLIEWLRSSSRT